MENEFTTTDIKTIKITVYFGKGMVLKTDT